MMLRRWVAAGSATKKNKPLGVITQHRSNKLWLESPVNLKEAAEHEVNQLHANLHLQDCSFSRQDRIRAISQHAFATAKSKLLAAPSSVSPEELEEVRGLLAMAVFHDLAEAKLFAAKLLLSGAWPQSQPTAPPAAEAQPLTPKQRGMSVIKEIRRLQKANRTGYSSNPPKDAKLAAQLLREAAYSSSSLRGEALLELGDLHFFPEEEEGGKDGVVVGQEEALQAYRDACSLEGNVVVPGAHYRLACALDSLGRTADAVKEFELAAEVDRDADAYLYLAHHLKTTSSSDNDAARAKHYLRIAGDELGSADALTYLAKWLLEEDAASSSAVQLLIRAAKLDNSEAMHMLADAHVDGGASSLPGIPIDMRRAVTLYCRSGEVGGNARAWVSAGALALQGFAPNPQEADEFAFQCYSKASECCTGDGDDGDDGGELHKEVWRRLAHLYMAGKGVERNEDTGRRILKLIGDDE